MELLENGLQPKSGEMPLFLMRVVSLVSCRDVAALTLMLGINGRLSCVQTERKRNFSLMFSVYSMIFFALTPAFAWCEYTVTMSFLEGT